MENVHCSLDPKDLEKALIDPKDHWDILEERKVRERRIETWYQRQSTLDGCVEEFRRRSAETKGCKRVQKGQTWLNCALLRITFAYGHLCKVCEVHEAVGV